VGQPGAISGVVTDGVSRRPIPGALVLLSDLKVKVSAGTVTDSKGRFVFTGLPASQGYRFRAWKSGFYNIGMGQGDAMPVLGEPRVLLPLAENQWRQNADVVLWPFGTIGGIVADEEGEPVVGVPVRVMTRIAAGGTDQWAEGPAATTDDRGIYRIDHLRRGTYVVHLPNVQSTVPPGTTPAVVAGMLPGIVQRNKGIVPSQFGLDLRGTWLALGQFAVPPPIDGPLRAYPPVFYPGSRSLQGAVAVELADGEHRSSIDFALQPVPTVSVSGRVIGPPSALAGLVVRLLPADSPVEHRNSEHGTALVSEDGTFMFLGVPQGGYTLSAQSSTNELRLPGSNLVRTPGLLPQGSMSFSSSASGVMSFESASRHGATGYFARTAVVVSDQDVTDVVLELSAGATISGRVVKEGEPPLRDLVYVRLSGTGEPTLVVTPSTQVVPEAAAAPGRFVIRDVPHGNYVIDANSMTAPSLVVKSIIGPDGDYADRPLQVMPGADIPELVITLTDRPATLRGVVRDRDGAVVPHAAVILFPADRRGWSHFGLSPSRIKSVLAADREGYTLSRLRAGAYLVVATDLAQASAWHDTRFLEAAAAVATPVTLDWGASTVLNLTRQQVIVR